MAGCCPYAACTYAAPIVLAAPSLLAKFRSSPPATQAISLALLPFVFAALASSAGVDVAGFFWGWITPPVLLAIAWLIYDAIDDRLEAQTGRLWDSARRRP